MASSSSRTNPVLKKHRNLKPLLAGIAAVPVLALLPATTASAATFYWDTDTTSAGNDAATGTGLGGTGNWSTATPGAWWDGIADSPLVAWTEGDEAVFAGTAGTVTLSGPRTAASLTFKTPDYLVTGSTLAMGAPATVTVDSGNATISSVFNGTVGYTKLGAGKLILTNSANANSGPVFVNAGTLELSTSGRIGATVAGSGLVTIDGGTLRNVDPTNGNSFLTANRGIEVGATTGVATVDAATTNVALIYAGTLTGSGGTTANGGFGTIVKTGPGEFRYQGANSANSTFQKLVINQGTWRQGNVTSNNFETFLGAAPTAFLADAVTLNGGVLASSGLAFTTHVNRGLTLGANGGEIRASVTIPGAIAGTQGGGLTFNGSTSTLSGANTYDGPTTIFGGGVLLISSDANLGVAPAGGTFLNIGGATTAGTLRITGSTTLDTKRTMAIGPFGGTLDTNAAAVDVSFGGVLTGTGNFTKTGAGKLTLSGNNTISGTVTSFGGGVLSVSSDANLGAVPTSFVANRLNLGGATTLGTLNTTATFATDVNRGVNLNAGGGIFSVEPATTLTVPAVVSGTGALNKTGAGTLVLNGANTYAGATKASAGKLLLGQSLTSSASLTAENDAVVELASGGTKVVKTGAVAVTGTAKIDLKDNKLVTSGVEGTWNGSAYTDVAGLVDAGRGNASNAQWDGTGIVTSDTRAVNNNDLVSIGTAKVGAIKGIADAATTTFAGQTVLGSDTIAMTTWGGDANLDGKINIDDYGQIDFNVASSGSVFGWYNGDFNYDGKINIDDYGIIDFNVSAQDSIFPTSGGAAPAGLDGVAAVPEPASLSLVALGAAGLMRRRRRAN